MMDPRRRYFVPLSVPLGFFVLISLFLGVRIYRDHTILIGDDLFYTDPAFRSFDGGVFNTEPSNWLMDVDNDLQNFPSRHYVQSSFARGEIPWWNPYIGMGIPFAALGSGVFDPVAALAGVFAPPSKLTNVIAVLSLLIGACGIYLFLGFLGASQEARILGAIAFTFCAWTIVWLGRQNAMTTIWMPWLFWAAGALVRKPSILPVGLFSLATALVCLPGHLQTSMHIFGALAIYILFLLFREKRAVRDRAWALFALVAAGGLGIGVALIQIVPLINLLGQSDPLSQNRGFQTAAPNLLTALLYGIKGDWTLMSHVIPTALTAIAPLFFGTPRHSNFWWPSANFPETIMYVGLLPFFFALYAFSRIRAHRNLRVWLILALLTLGAVYFMPLLNLINYLPGFDRVNNGRLRLVYHFAIIIAAAIGFDLFMSDTADRSRKGPFRFAAAFGAGVLALPVAFFLALPFTRLGGMAIGFRGADVLLNLVKSEEIPILVALIASALVLAAWKFRLLGPRVFRAAVLLITFLDLFLVSHDFNPLIPSRFVFPELKVVRFLKEHSGLSRISSTSFTPIMPANTKLPYGLFDTDLYSVLAIGRYSTLQALLSPPRPDALRPFRFTKPDAYAGLMDLMNVRYIVAPVGPAAGNAQGNPYGASKRYRLVYDGEVLVYENLEVLPRAFLVGRSKILPEPERILDDLLSPEFNPRQTVLLEDSNSPPVSGPHLGSEGHAEVISLTSNRVLVRARSAVPAYLVLSEMNYPGWEATVDGIRKEVYQADYLFRAVFLEAGTHEVVFHFMPKSYAVARKTSLACSAMTFLLIVMGVKRRENSQ